MSLLKYTVTPDAARIVNDETDATKQLVNAFATKHSVPSDLVELAQEVQRADQSVRSMAGGKLQIIAEQIRFLQEQARQVLEDAKESSLLHKAQCNFVKIPGRTYYLYLRKSGQSYFSMLSPAEWSECPHQFLGAYRLEYDRSWTKEENIPMKDQELTVIDNLINNTTGIPSLEYLAKAADKSERLAISEQSYESNDTCSSSSSMNIPEPQIEEVH